MEEEMKISLTRSGVDAASDTVQQWLEEAGKEHRDIALFRVVLEDMLLNICEHTDEAREAEMFFLRSFGREQLRIRYAGDRFDPRKPADNEIEAYTASLLDRTGIFPVWRWRFGHNELILPVSAAKKSAELVMLGCIAAAIAVGLLGQYIPETIRNSVMDYGLLYLSGGFLNLLNTFIGLMIFLTVITGICGIGSTAALGKVGKQMMIRFLVTTFATCGAVTAGAYLLFPLARDSSGGGAGFLTILDMLFGILPANPVKPFLDGNTLQIVFMAVLIGIILLLTGSQTENLRKIAAEAQFVVMRCVTAVCMLLPFYIFSSLVTQLWIAGPQMLARFWKPLAVCVLFSVILLALYTAYTCWKLKVKPAVLAQKLMPSFIIGLSTSSSSAAFTTCMEINEQKLGIDKSLSGMGLPIGSIIFAGSYSMMYVLAGAFMAECYGIHVDIAWWVTMWIVCSLLAISTPPVAGGNISCLSVMMLQLHIPAEGLALGVALAMFLDFLCTGTKIALLHMELALQADHMGLLNYETLRK